jgi:hypothetical protein
VVFQSVKAEVGFLMLSPWIAMPVQIPNLLPCRCRFGHLVTSSKSTRQFRLEDSLPKRSQFSAQPIDLLSNPPKVFGSFEDYQLPSFLG